MGNGTLTTSGLQAPVASEFGRAVLHPVMAYIGSIWPSFGAGKTAQKKRDMIASWETALSCVPVELQMRAIDAKVQSGQKWPPTSPAELIEWCDEIQPPMNGIDAAWYQSCMETGLLDADFCKRQIEKYKAAQAAGKTVYAGWDK